MTAKPALIGPLAYWQGNTEQSILHETIPEVLRRQARDYGERNALMWLEGEGIAAITYGELLEVAERVARWLLARAKPGDRVAIWSRNSVDWAIVEYACAFAGMNLTPWNTSWTDAEVSHALQMTQPSVVFTGSDTRGVDLRERATVLANQALVQSLDSVRSLSGEFTGELPQVSLDTPFLVQFTSGTTGQAKGAQLTQQAAMNGGYFRALSTAGSKDDIYLNPTPMHHVAGSVSLLLGTLSIGACYVIMGQSKPEDLIRAAKLSNATCFGGVPTMLIAMLEHPEFPKGGMNFRTLGTGGAQVPPALIERFGREFNAIVSVGYGQSECPLVSNTLADDSAEIIATTVGVACPATDVKIVDPNSGEILKIGEIGEICVRSAATMSVYYNAPEATSKTIDSEGFVHTGDLAIMNERGYLSIKGRAREVIIRGGENIYPIQIEQALHQHPAVSLAAAVGVADEKWGQQVGAVVRLVPEASVSEAELETFLRERIAHFNIPRYWRFVEELPMTASGKVRKVELTSLFATATTEE